MRQIILDTETTGLRVDDGHRIIEIACVEMLNRKLTGDYFHVYLNPERDIDDGATAVHGITTAFLKDKPLFVDVAQKMLDYISGSELVIHNAPFDISFLNAELKSAQKGFNSITDYCTVLDTLPMARQLHVGQRNSLDALCKRYGVDHSKREWHGALLDANLLAQVYLAMTGGQGSFFDSQHTDHFADADEHTTSAVFLSGKYTMTVIPASEAELDLHQQYLTSLDKQGKCLWTHSGDVDKV